jgi:hypothetical protein
VHSHNVLRLALPGVEVGKEIIIKLLDVSSGVILWQRQQVFPGEWLAWLL